ncbi:hypothetical protein HYH03_006171 [Edaphochlamys debaryana]|uniref:Uncharacterized protein n=1 Tax=Edaphochlamys debaryana TaxID=47281 RepID=A0A835Y411_9CHLO|nr:hypothetical protein HYH03_006171 [Edaphochlamys debaryana]|eukprot:KAG2495571.1 hypothetical protein HYH03_006171 [Edaphochlamys debaryana]
MLSATRSRLHPLSNAVVRSPVLLRHVQPLGLIDRRRAGAAQDPIRSLAARAKKSDDDDKSWGEIAQEAGQVAKSVFNKIKDAATSILPVPAAKDEKPVPRPRDPDMSLGPSTGGGLLPNLLGRAVGGLLSSAVSSLAKQVEAAARESAGAYEEAAQRIQSSAKLQDRLGTVTVGPLMSQSSSSSNINGVVTKQVMLLMPVAGSRGVSGQAQVSVVEGRQGRRMTIVVRTADGGVITLDDDGPGSARGAVIDVEYKEVQ